MPAKALKTFFLSSLLAVFSCSKQPVPHVEKPIDVTTYTVELQTIPINFQFVGTAQSSHLVEIWSRVEGYLSKIAYVEGGFINQGETLFEIDPRELQSAVKEAEGYLEKEKASLWSAQKAVERFKPLYEQKAASRKDLDDATSLLLSEEAAVAVFKAKLAAAKLDLSYATITSPVSGLTSSSKYQEGTLINPGVNGMLTTVSVVDPIWVIMSVSDYYFLTATQETEKGTLIIPKDFNFDVTITLADGTEFPHHGKVNFISPVLDPNTGTLSARAVFPNPEYTIKPGQFVRLTARGAERPNSIMVPQQAVQQGTNSLFVYVVNSDNRVEMRPVEVGDWYETNWIIKSGLHNGEEVVVEGVNKVSNGALINIINSQPVDKPKKRVLKNTK